MAKTYLEANPHATLLLLDTSPTLGGTWSLPRLYPTLKTNNVLGSYEFSDFPLDANRYLHLFPNRPVRVGTQHIPGEVVYRYLEDFARHFGLLGRIRWGVKVEEAMLRGDGGWRVGWRRVGHVYEKIGEIGGHLGEEKVAGQESNSKTQEIEGHLYARKLIIATGLTSTPHIPSSPPTTAFTGPIIHSIQLKTHSNLLATSKSVVVIGGNKSAWDVCYAAATAGAKVHMVMRPSGGGPSWVWPGVSAGSRKPLKIFGKKISLAKLSLVRATTWCDPNPFVQDTLGKLAHYILHQTWLGRLICALFWAMLDRIVQKANGYYGDDGDEKLRMLRPWTSTFWMGNSLSVHNYETDFFQLVREGKVVVHHADVESYGEKEVRLGNGECLEVDAVVFCTGWKSGPTIKFGPAGIEGEIGLPGYEYDSSYSTSSGFGVGIDEKGLNHLKAQVHQQILRESPILASKPIRTLPNSDNHPTQQEHEELTTSTPYRLYNHIVPPGPTVLHHRNLAFIGHHRSIHAALVAQAQALWITAFFTGHLDLPPSLPSPPSSPSPSFDSTTITQQTILSKTYHQTIYQALRHPPAAGGSGHHFPDLVFDSLPYIDILLGECGVRTMRKGRWWRDIFEAYGLRDYRGLVAEWLDVVREEEGKEQNANGNGKV